MKVKHISYIVHTLKGCNSVSKRETPDNWVRDYESVSNSVEKIPF